jgi:hypothetical protein
MWISEYALLYNLWTCEQIELRHWARVNMDREMTMCLEPVTLQLTSGESVSRFGVRGTKSSVSRETSVIVLTSHVLFQEPKFVLAAFSILDTVWRRAVSLTLRPLYPGTHWTQCHNWNTTFWTLTAAKTSYRFTTLWLAGKLPVKNEGKT